MRGRLVASMRQSSGPMDSLIDIFLHLDRYLADIAATYGPWIYGVLFAVVFAETGLVVTPFLPGDSLLFAAGALAGAGVLSPGGVAAVLCAAAIIGDNTNYFVGRFVGERIFTSEDRSTLLRRLLNRNHLIRAHEFFDKYGGKAVILGRFVPIVRTFVPFVAGAGAMAYPTFLFCSVFGTFAWVGICVTAGYAFGNVPIVKENFSLVALGIVFVSVLPALAEYVRSRRGGVAGAA